MSLAIISQKRESEGQQQSPAQDTVPGSKSSVLSTVLEGSQDEAPGPGQWVVLQSPSGSVPSPVMEKGRGAMFRAGRGIWGLNFVVIFASGWPRDTEKNSRNQQCTASARSQEAATFCTESLNLHFNPIGCCYYPHFTHEETEALRGHLSKVTWFETGGSLDLDRGSESVIP